MLSSWLKPKPKVNDGTHDQPTATGKRPLAVVNVKTSTKQRQRRKLSLPQTPQRVSPFTAARTSVQAHDHATLPPFVSGFTYTGVGTQPFLRARADAGSLEVAVTKTSPCDATIPSLSTGNQTQGQVKNGNQTQGQVKNGNQTQGQVKNAAESQSATSASLLSHHKNADITHAYAKFRLPQKASGDRSPDALSVKCLKQLVEFGVRFGKLFQDPLACALERRVPKLDSGSNHRAPIRLLPLINADRFALLEMKMSFVDPRRMVACLVTSREEGQEMCVDKKQLIAQTTTVWKRWNLKHASARKPMLDCATLVDQALAQLLTVADQEQDKHDEDDEDDESKGDEPEHENAEDKDNNKDKEKRAQPRTSKRMVLEDKEFYYLHCDWRHEENVRDAIVRLKRRDRVTRGPTSEVLSAIHKTCKSMGVALNRKQMDAVVMGLREPVFLVLGEAGTGKTMVMRVLSACVRELSTFPESGFTKHGDGGDGDDSDDSDGEYSGKSHRKQAHTVISCRAIAFTGRASKNLCDVSSCTNAPVDKYATTIHKYIMHQNHVVVAETVLIDEVSMVPFNLLSQLYSQKMLGPHGSHTKCIGMFGDHRQLSPVGKCSVLPDLMAVPECVPCVVLDEPQRNSNKQFLRLAWLVYNWSREYRSVQEVVREFVRIGNEADSGVKVVLLDTATQEDVARRLVCEYTERWQLLLRECTSSQSVVESAYAQLLLIVPNSSKYFGDKDDQERKESETPTRSNWATHGQSGIRKVATPYLNEVIRRQLHNDPTLEYWKIKVGDKVTATSNNYTEENELELAKGQICRVTAVSRKAQRDQKDHKAREEKPEWQCSLQSGDGTSQEAVNNKSLDHAHAVTVHKSQGLGVDFVIFGFHQSCGSDALLSRELLYTAITRTQKHCVLVGTYKALEMMLTSKVRDLKTSSQSRLAVKLRKLWAARSSRNASQT